MFGCANPSQRNRFKFERFVLAVREHQSNSVEMTGHKATLPGPQAGANALSRRLANVWRGLVVRFDRG